MFVVMALVTTFLTTPLTVSLYPAWYQIKVDRWRRGEIDWNDNPLQYDGRLDSVTAAKDEWKTVPVRKLLVYLRLDGLSGICTLAAILSPNRIAALSTPQVHPSKIPKQTDQTVEDAITSPVDEAIPLRVHGVRLIELTDRDSSVMKVTAGDNVLWDPVVNTFRTFGEWHNISLKAGVSVVPEHSYADTVINMTRQDTSDLLLLPWSETGTLADRQSGLEVDAAGRFVNGEYARFISDILDRVPGHVGILIDHSPESYSAAAKRPTSQPSLSGLSTQSSTWTRPPTTNRSRHIVLPFSGGDDDCFALRFALQLAQNDQVTATIIPVGGLCSNSIKGTASSVPVSRDSSDVVFYETIRDSIPEDLKERVIFQSPAVQDTISDPTPLALAAVREELKHTSNKSGNMVIVGRSSRLKLDLDITPDESVGTDTRRALGSVGSAMVQPENKIFGSVLVLQAGMNASLLDSYR